MVKYVICILIGIGLVLGADFIFDSSDEELDLREAQLEEKHNQLIEEEKKNFAAIDSLYIDLAYKKDSLDDLNRKKDLLRKQRTEAEIAEVVNQITKGGLKTKRELALEIEILRDSLRTCKTFLVLQMKTLQNVKIRVDTVYVKTLAKDTLLNESKDITKGRKKERRKGVFKKFIISGIVGLLLGIFIGSK